MDMSVQYKWARKPQNKTKNIGQKHSKCVYALHELTMVLQQS